MAIRDRTITVELLTPEEEDIVAKMGNILTVLDNLWSHQALFGVFFWLSATIGLIFFGGQALKELESAVGPLVGVWLAVAGSLIGLLLLRFVYFNWRRAKKISELKTLAENPLARSALGKLSEIQKAAQDIEWANGLYKVLKHPPLVASPGARRLLPWTA